MASPLLSPLTKDLTARWKDLDGKSSVTDEVIQQARLSFAKSPASDRAFVLAELQYAAGAKAEASGSEHCVDLYYEAATLAYFALFAPGATLGSTSADRMCEVYY